MSLVTASTASDRRSRAERIKTGADKKASGSGEGVLGSGERSGRTVTVFALSLFPSETLAWTGVTAWHVEGPALTMLRGDSVEVETIPPKYIGFYARVE